MNSKQEARKQGILTLAYHDYEKGLNLYSFFKLRDRALSEDLVQETFMKTWTYLVKGGKVDMMKGRSTFAPVQTPMHTLESWGQKILGDLAAENHLKGLKTAARPGGMGLNGMRARARSAGGELETKPSPGGGLTIEVWAPLQKANAEMTETIKEQV